jgi:hypothetical protein
MAVAAVGVMLALVALAAWQSWWPFGGRTASPATKKQWILVAEFEGPRDEPDIARAAQGLTAAALDQSGIVMTVPRDELSQALEQAGKPDTLRVDGSLARVGVPERHPGRARGAREPGGHGLRRSAAVVGLRQ